MRRREFIAGLGSAVAAGRSLSPSLLCFRAQRPAEIPNSLLRLDFGNEPVNNAVGAVVTSMHPGNVDTVMIGGKLMKRNGQMIGVDFSRVNNLVVAARDRALATAKYERARF